MAQAVFITKYFKMLVPQKAGQGLKILEPLQRAKVDLLSLLAFPKKKRAQIDIVPADPSKFTAVAKREKWKIKTPKTCFVIEGKDQIGALVPITEKLAKAKINIRAMATITGGAGRCGAILWVDPKDIEKTTETLSAKER